MSDLDAKLAEWKADIQRALNLLPSRHPQLPATIVEITLNRAEVVFDALQAVLAIREEPNPVGVSDLYYGKTQGYNQALADVIATIEGKVT